MSSWIRLNENSEELNQDTEYNLKSGFFFSINDFIDYISNIKHIFMSKNDYDKDKKRYRIHKKKFIFAS